MHARVRAEALGFTAGNNRILDGVRLEVAPGERLGVIGPNGSGKSTLLRCLYAWHRPSCGSVFLDGIAVAAMAPRERARHIAALTQESESGLGLTVSEIVELGRLPHAEKGGLQSIMAELDLTALADRPFMDLSGGEKQRVLFARALAQAPRCLILDEPTNHLDIRHQLEILAVTLRLGVTVVAALHDINLAAAWCDRLCLLQRGRVRAIGTPDDVLDPGLIGEVYGVGVDRDTDPRSGRPRLSFHLVP